MRPRFVILLCLLFLAPLFSGAQVSFSTIADELSIHLNDVVQVQFIAENATQIEDFRAPAFRDFKVMHGPIETSGMSMVNNQVTQYKALTYILQPLRKGRLSIPGASALINGKKMQSNKIIIEVGDNASRQTNPYPMNPGISPFQQTVEEEYLLSPGENAGDKIKDNLLVRLELDKTTAYIGEPIVASYKLYTRLRSESRVSKRPSMNGFSVYDMIEPDGSGPTIEILNGKSYQVHIIRKTQLFPLQEGEFMLEPVELENVVRFLRTGSESGQGSNRSPLQKLFDDLLTDQQGNWEEHRVTLSSKPERITIKALPEGAPASFNGAVGKFTISGKLLNSVIAAGDNATFELFIDGKGNLPLVNAPQLTLPEGFTQFDPQVTEEINKMVAPMEGFKKFSFAIIPETPGKYLLPAVPFSYFDPSTRQYRTIQTDSIRLEVTPAANRKPASGPATGVTIPAKEDNRTIWIIGMLGAIAMLATIFLLLKKQKPSSWTIKQAETAPSKPAETAGELLATPALPQIPSDPFATAREAVVNNDPPAFYHAIDRALWEIISGKLQLAGSSEQKPLAMQLLAAKGFGIAESDHLKKCWQQCEWALYTPSTILQIDNSLLDQAESLAATIEAL
ncbi:BatD family protein [Flavihumibacter stibioxidans]|uniref:BatD family protein n=1 Tax=Flavihumibacter stibioxidans TaxID=1834163 RepID=UPI0016509D86